MPTPKRCSAGCILNHLYHTLAAKPEPLNGATRIARLHLVRISSNSHRLALSFTSIVRSVYLTVPAAEAGFAFSHSLVRWPLNRCTVSTPGNAPGVSRFQGERITFFLDTETRYYLHTPGRVEVLAQKPRTASENSILPHSLTLVKPSC